MSSILIKSLEWDTRENLLSVSWHANPLPKQLQEKRHHRNIQAQRTCCRTDFLCYQFYSSRIRAPDPYTPTRHRRYGQACFGHCIWIWLRYPSGDEASTRRGYAVYFSFHWSPHPGGKAKLQFSMSLPIFRDAYFCRYSIVLQLKSLARIENKGEDERRTGGIFPRETVSLRYHRSSHLYCKRCLYLLGISAIADYVGVVLA